MDYKKQLRLSGRDHWHFVLVWILLLSVCTSYGSSLECRHLFPAPTEYVVQSAQPFRFTTYFIDKLSDISYIDTNLISQAKLRMKILLESSKTENIEHIPLDDLHLIHPINSPSATKKLAERADMLHLNWDAIVAEGSLSIKLQQMIIPSKAPIRVYETQRHGYVVFDGNGRLAAIQAAFRLFPSMPVEVIAFRSNNLSIENLIEEIMLENGALEN